ncbi:type III PLP-dependent enzyme [Streptomyces sp. NPDC002588]|uniref:type III PLP-dependent enzyme n=1 Tax=Streptomyces sp. NPDC002588 TaxID=3154419 RepID=UPI00332087AF
MTTGEGDTRIPAGDARLTELARRFGTPAYVYDLGRLAPAVVSLTTALPGGARLLYSLKANPHPALVGRLGELGVHAEVSSEGELRTALSAGRQTDQILYTGPGKTAGEVRTALAAGIRLFSVESLTDRGRLAEQCAQLGVDTRYLVRLNGPRGSTRGSLRMTGRPSAFGVDTADVDALAELLRPLGRARPVGTHTFAATNIDDPHALLAEFALAVDSTAEAVGRAGFVPEILDLGGGFPAPSGRPGDIPRHPRLARGLAHALDARFPGWRAGRPRILFEAGRSLVATAGTLLTTVLDVKRSGGRTFTVLDAGVNVLGGMSGLGRLLAPGIQPYALDEPAPAAGEPEPGRAGTLVGPLCTPLDVLSGSAALEDPYPGQLIAVPNVGAYGLTASLLGFLSRPLPVEVVVEDDRVLSARRLVLQPMELTPRD